MSDKTFIKSLPISLYGDWFEAIWNDDSESIRQQLNDSSSEHREKLLNGYFDYEDSNLLTKGTSCTFCPKRPLCLAVSCFAFKVVQEFVQQKVDITQREQCGFNIFHCLVAPGLYDKDQETMMVKMYDYLEYLFTIETLITLLYQEENIGLRPLEMCLHYGCYTMFKRIMETDSVYMKCREIHGSHIYTWYDITDYERFGKNSRRDRSPLLLLNALENKNLSYSATKEVVTCTLITTWSKAKMSFNKPFIIIWFIIRLLFLVTFFLSTSDEKVINPKYITFITSFSSEDDLSAAEELETQTDTLAFTTTETSTYNFLYNSSVKGFKNNIPDLYLCENSLYYIPYPPLLTSILLYYVLANALCFIIYDICEYFISIRRSFIRKLRTTPKGRKQIMVSTTFQRICSFLFSIFSISATLGMLSGFSRVVAYFICIWPLLCFLELLPSIGYLVLLVQKALKDVLSFGFILFVFLIPYPHGFFNILKGICGEESFANIGAAMYSSFKLMLNMIDLEQYKSKEGVDLQALYFMHVFYVFLVVILLLNFLIAILSYTVSEVSENRSTITVLQKLSMLNVIERRLNWVFRIYYRWCQKKTFCVENGRIFIILVSDRPKLKNNRLYNVESSSSENMQNKKHADETEYNIKIK